MSDDVLEPGEEELEWASKSRAMELDEYIDEILGFLGQLDGGVWVITDESELGDLFIDQKDLDRLSKKMGFRVHWDDKIWKIAEHLRAKKWGSKNG